VAGLAVVVFALLGLIGLTRLASSTDLAWGHVRTDGSAPEAPAPQAAPPTVPSPAPPHEAAPHQDAQRQDAAPNRPQPDPAWVNRVAVVTGIPVRALEAYAQTTLLLADEQPRCRVGWPTLAGIGKIESGHGTQGGTHLLADGRPAIPILGPALDGSAGFAAIPATTGSTALHGDARWDHAIGPMQFIPSTWLRWASDGDGDGRSDPNNIDDAAYAAGRYLCASGADLTTGAGWHRAILSYNHSDQYAADGLDAANRYARASTTG
jgi:membrane-bound lytic murein transglycosylase B